MLYRLKPDVATTIPTIGESLHERENAHVARFITSDECILHIYVISSKYCMLLKPCCAFRNVHGVLVYTNVAAVKRNSFMSFVRYSCHESSSCSEGKGK